MRGTTQVSAEDKVTEVPEYLFERSRQRRIALGLLEDDGSGGGASVDSSDSGGQASSGPSSADVIAAAKADAKLEQVGETADPWFRLLGNEPRFRCGRCLSCSFYRFGHLST